MYQGEDMAMVGSTRLMLRELSEKDQKHHTYMKRSPSKQFEDCGSRSTVSEHCPCLGVRIVAKSPKNKEEGIPRAADRCEP
jgi:hypothetical protein